MARKIYHLNHFSRNGDQFFVRFSRSHGEIDESCHRHDFVEIMYLISGHGVNYVDDVPYPILPGDLYIINRGSTHAFRVSGDFQYYTVMFRPSEFSGRELKLFRRLAGFEAFFSSRPPADGRRNIAKIFLPPPFAGEVTRLLEQLCAEDLKYPEFAAITRKAGLRLLLAKIWRSHQVLAEQFGDRLGASGADENGAFLPLMNYLNANFDRRLSLRRLAAEVHLSPSYIGEFFRRKTGSTLVKYINSLRIEKARIMLLDDPERPVSEIAAACGVPDSSYFTRLFRTATGCSPAAYRERFGH